MLRLSIIGMVILTTTLLAQVQPKPKKDLLSKDEQAILDATNAQRKAHDLPPLVTQPTLQKLAREHAQTMARLRQLGHDLGGKTFVGRIKESGYRYARIAENVAEGQPTAKAAVATWMNSPGHRANLLDSRLCEIGVAVAISAEGRRYWVQVFGTPLK